MCDTLCALPARSLDGGTLFAKNSDRSPNEPHLVIHVPAGEHAPGSSVKLTYITVPQAEQTLEVILCRPSWMWGAEMGVNSAGVAIGNEAVFTRAGRGPEALTGMDLVRLGLERAQSAAGAVGVITALLEKYGQGGNCGFDHEFYYDNSFMVADPREGYVVETSGRRWVAAKVAGSRAISNRLTIHREHTMRGGVKEGYDFARRLTEPVYTHFSGSKRRIDSSLCALGRPVDAAQLMAALRRHDPRDEAGVFTRGSVRSVCMHAGGIVGDHSTGSLIAALREGKPPTLWATGASTPCISAFKPVFFGADTAGPVFEEAAAAKSYWLEREALHRGVLAGRVDVVALRAKIAALEREWVANEHALFEGGAPGAEALRGLARSAAAQERELVAEFTPSEGFSMPAKGRFNRYWAQKNAALGQER